MGRHHIGLEVSSIDLSQGRVKREILFWDEGVKADWSAHVEKKSETECRIKVDEDYVRHRGAVLILGLHKRSGEKQHWVHLKYVRHYPVPPPERDNEDQEHVRVVVGPDKIEL